MQSKKETREVQKIPKPLKDLAKECKDKGNRLEVVNGKVYEVSRKLIGTIE